MGTVTHLPVHQEAPDGYITGPDLCHQARITYRQLDYWTRTGRLRAINPRPGSGFPHLYPDDEIPVAAHMGALTAAGLGLQAAATTARALARGDPAHLGPYVITPTHQEDSST